MGNGVSERERERERARGSERQTETGKESREGIGFASR